MGEKIAEEMDVKKPAAEDVKEEKENKAEEKSAPEKEEKKTEASKDAKDETPAPAPPPPEIVLKVYMHCEGCARKVRRCLRGFEGN